MEKTAEELMQERAGRVKDALDLRIPDRVPLEIAFGYFPAKYAGIKAKAAYYDYEAWLAACRKTVVDFGADISSVQPFFPGRALELLDPKTVKWPGYNAPEEHGHQYVEGELMEVGEYPLFLKDQTDFLLRRYLPRALGAMQAFARFPSLAGPPYGYYSGLAVADAFCDPEVIDTVEKLRSVGTELRRWRNKMEAFDGEFRKLGFPPFMGGLTLAPFDALSDHLRGMRGSMLDLYRQPELVVAACEAILDRMVRDIRPALPGGVNTIGIPLHRGSEGFMSIEQFERFYWPGLKGLILALIDRGITPLVFFEGDYTSRLEYLRELPRGKIFAHMDSSDIFRVKEVIGGHLCFSGNVPCSLLRTGTVDEVKDHCKRMIDVCARDGGFIMSTRSPVDDAKPELLKAMIDFTKEYRIYG